MSTSTAASSEPGSTDISEVRRRIAGGAGAVFAGGKSVRMGVDKASLVVGGVPLARRAVSALAATGLDPVVVIGGATGHGVELVPDLEPGSGPLGALVTALRYLGTDVVILPCDLPRVSPADVAALLDAASAVLAEDPGIDVCVVTRHGRPAFPCGWWSRTALGPAQAAFDDGVRSIHGALLQLGVSRIELGRGFDDADSPDDLPGVLAWDATDR